MIENKINIYIEKFTIKVNITGDWNNFISPVKDKFKLKKYKWDKEKKVWKKDLSDIRIKEQLKDEYTWIKAQFKNEYLNFGNLKDYLIKLNEEKEIFNNQVLTENNMNLESLPKEIFDKMMKHQKEAIPRYNKQKGRLLLGWTMGVGKTFGSLAIAKSKNKKMLIIVPKSLLDQWREQILKWNINTNNKIFIIESNMKYFNYEYDIYITNYEKFRFLEKEKLSEKDNMLNTFLNTINKEDFIIIYDEMYKIKNYKSTLHKAHQKLLNTNNWNGVIGLNGTPQENNIFEFYTLLNFIQPNIITWEEMERHFIYRDFMGNIKFKNLNYFNQLANKIMFRVTKEDVKSDLPKLSLSYRFINHSKKANELKNLLLDTSPLFENYMTLRVLDSYFMPHEELKKYEIVKEFGEIEPTEKLEELLDILEEIGTEKVLIFTTYSTTMNWLIQKLKDKYKVSYVDSSVKDREKVKKDFVEGDIQIVVATEVWSRGVDLPTIDYLINWDLPLNPAIFEQRRDRIYRINSENPKCVISLISDIIEKDIFDLIKNKIESAEQTVEGITEENLVSAIAKKWGIDISKNKKTKNED
jgi:SNF2 family DNA or RNA helicase